MNLFSQSLIVTLFEFGVYDLTFQKTCAVKAIDIFSILFLTIILAILITDLGILILKYLADRSLTFVFAATAYTK